MEKFIDTGFWLSNSHFGLIILLCLLVFCAFRLRLLLMFFQQEEYENTAFLRLVFGGFRLIDKKLVLALGLLWLFRALVVFPVICAVLAIIIFAFFVRKEGKYMKKAKKKLVMTWRAKRLLLVAFLLTFAGVSVLHCLLPDWPLILAIITIWLLPFLLVLANIILMPVEALGRRKFVRMAAKKMDTSGVVVIGVTGSYGKTSVKHFLAHILSAGSSVLFTPGSVNTLLGVSRIINEKLQPSHKFFIVEMGAYYIGSIKKLCDLVHPKHGIITAIGEAHFSRFKTKENVAKAKFELADAVGKNGILVLNGEQIEKRFFKLAAKSAIPVGGGYDFYVTDVKQTADGLSFTYHYGKEKMQVKAPIYGEHHAQNIAMAMTMAFKLGMPKATVLAALRTLPQVVHRLEVKRDGGVVMIDDGYNSNPKGFASALDLLKVLKGKGARGILITPGMVEMGELHDKVHFELGKQAGKVADVLVAVVPDRITAFIKGYKQTAGDKAQVIKMAGFAGAKKWMKENLVPGDVVLIENDLPDSYEKGFSL